MKRTLNNKPSKIIVVIVVLLFVGGFGVYGYSRLTSDTPAQTAAHYETNSDGHHNKDSENVGDIIDLSSQTAVSIDIKDYKYSQPNIKIRKGTTVTWTNQDDMKHNVMKEHEDSDAAHDAPTLEEVKSDVFAGQLLAKGESYSFTFNTVGQSSYHCSPHPYMKGSITVVD